MCRIWRRHVLVQICRLWSNFLAGLQVSTSYNNWVECAFKESQLSAASEGLLHTVHAHMVKIPILAWIPTHQAFPTARHCLWRTKPIILICHWDQSYLCSPKAMAMSPTVSISQKYVTKECSYLIASWSMTKGVIERNKICDVSHDWFVVGLLIDQTCHC